MNGFLWFGLVLIYLVLVFTVCVMTFRKGHTLLGVFGFFFPILWLIGAIMAPTPNSSYAAQGHM
jgi:hypothetical protein